MLEESRMEFMIRWHLYRRWKRRPSSKRVAEFTFHKMMERAPAGIFLDLGANIGSVTAAALSYGLEVIAFEPDPLALATLKARFSSDPRVTIIPKAVGAQARTATFYHLPEYTEASSLIKTAENSVGEPVEVDVINIVDFINGLDKPISVIKMDIEGAEAECLEAIISAGLHKSVGHILVECHDRFSPDISSRLDKIREEISSNNIVNINLNWV